MLEAFAILSLYSSTLLLKMRSSIWVLCYLELQVWYLTGSYPGALTPLTTIFSRELCRVMVSLAVCEDSYADGFAPAISSESL